MSGPADDSSVLLKIYGERHTGTNVLQRMISKWPGVRLTKSGHYLPRAKDSLRDLRARRGDKYSETGFRLISERMQDCWTAKDGPLGAWKHAAAVQSPVFAESRLKVLFVVKAPGAWVTSFFRRPYHRIPFAPRGETIGDFVQAPWISVRREFTPRHLPSPLMLWNLKVASYLRFAREAPDEVSCRIVLSEDVVLDQTGAARGIADWLGVDPPKLGVRTDAVRGKDRSIDELRDYYGNERWRSELDAVATAAMERIIDPSLLEPFGYRL